MNGRSSLEAFIQDDSKGCIKPSNGCRRGEGEGERRGGGEKQKQGIQSLGLNLLVDARDGLLNHPTWDGWMMDFLEELIE